MMTPDEFKAAGLDKLSEDELQHLDAWLQGYRQTAERKASEVAEKKAGEEIQKANEEARVATAKATEQVKTKKLGIDRIVSRVNGNLFGLDGRTVITLEDGTVWKQANKEDHYQSVVTDHPLASVTHTTFGYRMRVEGMPEFYVNPVRNKK